MMHRVRIRLCAVPLALLLSPGAALGQNQAVAQPLVQGPPKEIEKVIPVRNLAGTERLNRLAKLLKVYNVVIVEDPVLKAIAVRGPQESVAEVEKAVAAFDVAPKHSVEVIAYLLAASPDAATAGPLPAPLEPVTRELASVFGYKGFSLRESTVLRTAESSSASAAGYLPVGDEHAAPRIYRISFDQAEIISDGSRRSVRMSRVRFRTEILYQTKEGKLEPLPLDVFVDALDVPEGKMVVVGKSNIHEKGDVIFLVVSARAVS